MSLAERFWPKVDRKGPNDCWLWKAAKLPSGYGKLGNRYAHHVALELAGMKRPDGLITLHSCDNPSCVNPAHLRWGTQAENMRSAIAKGRAPHTGRVAGEKNGNAVLSPDQVLEIRVDPRMQRKIAAEYGISRQLVSAIKCRTAWKHL